MSEESLSRAGGAASAEGTRAASGGFMKEKRNYGKDETKAKGSRERAQGKVARELATATGVPI